MNALSLTLTSSTLHVTVACEHEVSCTITKMFNLWYSGLWWCCTVMWYCLHLHPMWHQPRRP